MKKLLLLTLFLSSISMADCYVIGGSSIRYGELCSQILGARQDGSGRVDLGNRGLHITSYGGILTSIMWKDVSDIDAFSVGRGGRIYGVCKTRMEGKVIEGECSPTIYLKDGYSSFDFVEKLKEIAPVQVQ